MDNTPTKSNTSQNETCGDSLYEIPQCTICLQQLNQDFGSLSCGHVFHINCITQNFEYRGVCPNCQKRACSKQIRFLHFPLVKNTKASMHFRKLLQNLNLSEKKQVEQLLKQMRHLSQISQRLKNQKVQADNQLKNHATKISNLLDQLHKKKNETEMLKKQNLAIKSNVDGLSNQLSSLQRSNIYLRVEVEKHEKLSKEYEQYRKIKRLMNEHSQEIVKYKNQLQMRNTPIDQIGRIIFDMLLMKNLQLLKMKEKVQEFPEKISQFENQNRRLKEILQGLKRQIRQNNQKKVIDRRRYQDLKNKFTNLREKAKLRGLRDNDIPDMQDSQTFVNLKNPHVTPVILLPEKTLNIQNAIRKPMLNQTGSSTIGGFALKKKDDKLKMFG